MAGALRQANAVPRLPPHQHTQPMTTIPPITSLEATAHLLANRTCALERPTLLCSAPVTEGYSLAAPHPPITTRESWRVERTPRCGFPDVFPPRATTS